MKVKKSNCKHKWLIKEKWVSNIYPQHPTSWTQLYAVCEKCLTTKRVLD